MLDICTKVCMGCKYITSLRLVHMDIAARNVLVGDKNTVKVADFGLTRPMDKGQNYYRLKERLTISVKWSSVEALKLKVSLIRPIHSLFLFNLRTLVHVPPHSSLSTLASLPCEVKRGQQQLPPRTFLMAYSLTD